MKKLSYGRQNIDQNDIDSVCAAMSCDFLTTGPKVVEFETLVATSLGAKYAVSCSSGTAALHLAMLSLGIGPGDVVLVPGITFVATANAVRYTGADVIFCDVDPESGLMSAATLMNSLDLHKTKNIRAVITVHLNGQCTDMKSIAQICKKNALYLVEDACHAIGSQLNNGAYIGDCSFSDLCVFSFHPVKNITSAEGGMLLCNQSNLADRAILFRGHGINRNQDEFEHTQASIDTHGQVNSWYYEMQLLGFNYRLSDLNCSLGISQFKKLPGFVRARQKLIQYYRQRIESLSPHICMIKDHANGISAWHLCVLLIDFDHLNIDRNQLMLALADSGILTQVHYQPVYSQPYYQRLYGMQKLPGCEAYYQRCLSFPLYVSLTEKDVDRVVNSLVQIACANV